MWSNETIFSEGDLSDDRLEDYEKFIKKEYNCSFLERWRHVKHMMDRLETEKNLLLIKYLKTAVRPSSDNQDIINSEVIVSDAVKDVKENFDKVLIDLLKNDPKTYYQLFPWQKVFCDRISSALKKYLLDQKKAGEINSPPASGTDQDCQP